MDMNPKVTSNEQLLFNQLLPMQQKQIFFKTLGDGEIEQITRKNDLSGLWVYFFTNDNGGYSDKMDGQEFLNEVESFREFD